MRWIISSGTNATWAEALHCGSLKTHKQKRRSLLIGVFVKYGAGNETRTRDPDLGKVVLYQLSYSRIWRPLGDSNPCYRRERAVS